VLSSTDATSDLVTDVIKGAAPSGRVEEDFEADSRLRRLLPLLAIAFSAASAPVADTPQADVIWGTSSVLHAEHPLGPRLISPTEAREIALDVLRQAEDERARFAERESAIQAVWETEG
jgi:hypothetical protein